MIDNYDSFTYNLVQLFGMLGAEMVVRRNDAIALDEVAVLAPRAIVISPGPCTPNEAGVSLDLIRNFLGKIPILGVCLGHQAIAQALGGRVVRAQRVVHGKTSQIHHENRGLFANLDNPFQATRYHSLVAERQSLSPELRVSAWTDDQEIMGLAHVREPCVGVQFHPESVLTLAGPRLGRNFLDMAEAFWAGTLQATC